MTYDTVKRKREWSTFCEMDPTFHILIYSGEIIVSMDHSPAPLLITYFCGLNTRPHRDS